MDDEPLVFSELGEKIDLLGDKLRLLSGQLAKREPLTDYGTRIRQVTTALFYAGIAILLTEILFVISSSANVGSKALEVAFQMAMGAFMFRFWIYHTLYLERYPSDFNSLVFQFWVAISFILLLAFIATRSATVFLFFATIVCTADIAWCSYERKRLGRKDIIECDDLRHWYSEQFARWRWGASSKLLASALLLPIVGIFEGLEKISWKEPALFHVFNYVPKEGYSVIEKLLMPKPTTENILYVVVAVFIAVRLAHIIKRCREDLEQKREILNKCRT